MYLDFSVVLSAHGNVKNANSEGQPSDQVTTNNLSCNLKCHIAIRKNTADVLHKLLIATMNKLYILSSQKLTTEIHKTFIRKITISTNIHQLSHCGSYYTFKADVVTIGKHWSLRVNDTTDKYVAAHSIYQHLHVFFCAVVRVTTSFFQTYLKDTQKMVYHKYILNYLSKGSS